MQNDEDRLDRAKQFMPFDALKGFREALLEKEKEVEERVVLEEDKLNYIDNVLRNIEIGDTIKITYYENYKYISKKIKIKSINISSNKLIINSKVFYFKNIKDIIIID